MHLPTIDSENGVAPERDRPERPVARVAPQVKNPFALQRPPQNAADRVENVALPLALPTSHFGGDRRSMSGQIKLVVPGRKACDFGGNLFALDDVFLSPAT
jgi:hypothetical protein